VRRIVIAAIVAATAGCASWSVFERPSGALLVRADRLAEEGEYARAVQAYDELLARYPDDTAAARVRGRRDTVTRLIAAREEVERLRQALAARERELGQAREALAGRDGDVQRARQELQRVSAESARLRADLERLKQIDLETERRRR
jgi:chromosome segregation ATPase